MSHPHPELQAPPKLPSGALRIVALGGLGEIGRNMTVFEHEGKLLIVDCGVLFPEEHQPGVDVILPDFTWIRDRLDKIVGVVLTHGHEDHIGGVPYLLRERPDIPADRLAADAGADQGEAQGAPHPPGAARGQGGRPDRPGPLRLRVRRGQPLDPRRPGRGDPHPRRHGAAHRRLQDGPVPPRRPDHRPARLRAAGRGGRRPLHDRLHQRRGARLHHLRARPDPGDRARLPHRAAPRDRLELRQPRAPHPAGARHRARARPQGRLRGPLHGPQHGRGRRPGLPQGARGPDRAARPARAAARQQGHPDLHRLAGRAAGRAVADGLARPQDPRRRGRHHPDGQLGDPGQRERHLQRDQRADPLGRQRRAQGQRQGARLGPRQRRRARLLLQHHQAAQRDARARRVPPPARQRRPGDRAPA